MINLSSPEAIVAELVSEAVRSATGRSGVLIRDVPSLRSTEVLAALSELTSQGYDLRIAYLSPVAAGDASAAGLSEEVFSTQVEQAEQWRNERGLEALIVVVADFDAAKLTSLEDFTHIGPTILRDILVQRAVAQFAELNDVLPMWWTVLRNDGQVSLSDLVDYYLGLAPLTGVELRDAAAMQINRLGLLPDPNFFNGANEQVLTKKLADNRDLALRLTNFSEEDRQRVEKSLSQETDAARRAELRGRLRDLQTYRRGGQLHLTASDAAQLLQMRRSASKRPRRSQDEPGDDGQTPAPTPTTLNGLAVENLLRDEETPDDDVTDAVLDDAVESIRNQVVAIDDSTVRPEPVGVTLPSGARVDMDVVTDLLNLVSRLIGEDRYGGFLRAAGDDVTSMVRGYQQASEVVTEFSRVQVMEFLNGFAGSGTHANQVSAAFKTFDDARTALLPHLGELYVAPLLVASAPGTRPLVNAVIDAYRALLKATQDAYAELHESFGDDARAFVEQLILLDTIFLQNRSSDLIAILSPLHPTLLWHYAEYGRVLGGQKHLLDDRDRLLIRAEFESGSVPLFFSSLAVPRTLSTTAPVQLPFTGRFGGLPMFGSTSDALDPADGVRSIHRLLEAFVSMYPSAAEGLRLALLEPPDAGVYLSLICDLADRGVLRGAHVSVLRQPGHVGAELNLSGDEERRVQQRFGNHQERRFTFDGVRIGPGELAAPTSLSPHLYIAFDQSEQQTADSGAPLQHIQPLANRRRLAYRIQSGSLDLEPALGGILAEFGSLAGLAVGKTPNSYASVHQSRALEERLRAAAATVPWYVVADSHVDRDLDLGALRVFTERDGTRDVAAFTATPAAFRRSLREVVRQFNTSVTDSTLDELLRELSNLLDAGLLSLRPGRSGDTVESHVRGILGLLVSVRALRDIIPAGHDRVILSLDSEQARRWLHLADDPRRADLLVLDSSDDGFAITTVEVKTVQDSGAEYTVSGGVAKGPAVEQLLSTNRLLHQVFDHDHEELLVTPSRREVLREHLYRELSKPMYDVETKKRWVTRSRALFDWQPEAPDVQFRTALIDVHLGHATAGLEPARDVHARQEDELVPVRLMHLNEDGVPALALALTSPENPDEPEDDPHGAPVPPSAPPSAPEPADSASGEPKPVSHTEGSMADVALRPRALIGMGATRGSAAHEVWFDPQLPGQQLSNPHISISGETGSGKTQATKGLLRDLLPKGLPALILDFKDDYSQPDYARTEGFTVHDVSFTGLAFNPMVPRLDPQSGRVNPVAHIHELVDMLQRIYGLGDQQAYSVREAMKETYHSVGISDRPFIPDPGLSYPAFDAIRDALAREKATAVLGRLSPIFDLGLFSDDPAPVALDTLLSTPTVIRLSQLPGDTVKNAVAEFFLMALYGYLIRREHPHRLQQILVLDEAWRLVNSPFLVPLMREGRAFGLGVIVATQFPKDLPDEVGGSTGTRIFFNQTKADQVREVQRTLIGKTSGTEADHLGNLVRGLAPMECLVQNLQNRPYTRIRAVPYFARAEAPSGAE
ncbi:helicase HerA domain-containing protein [Microbacterium sp.]|uniref:helicase HerA domain-containing protein n=1 Tax=Microbacterium sp. TaxID=51671 RepID=UPI003A9218D8